MSLELDNAAIDAIQRVKKLFALAGNNPNENEAAAASAKAMEILERHNLSLAELKDRDDTERKDKRLKGGLYAWQRELWKAVCELHFCVYWSVKGNAKGDTYQHRVLGRHVNVILAEQVAGYLQTTIERLAQANAKGRGLNVFCREAIAFREGMSDRLVERLEKMRREKLKAERKRKEDAERTVQGAGFSMGGGTALTLVDVKQTEDDLNHDYVMGWPPGETLRRRQADQMASYAARERLRKEAEERDELEAREPWRKAERLREEAETEARWEKQVAEWAKKDAANAKAQQRRAERNGGPRERYRAETPREQRRHTYDYAAGLHAGDNVNLDPQVDRQSRKGIK